MAVAEGLLAAPWRMFFALAGGHALLAPPLALLAGLDPAHHGTGMVLGLGLASVAGYALTALPGWDGAGPVRGHTTALLAVLWGLALLAAEQDMPLLAWIFPLAFAGVLLRRRRGDGKRLVVCAAVFAVTAATLGLGPAAGVAVLAALVCFIGGRAVPAFLQSAAGSSAVLPRVAPALAAVLTLTSLIRVEAAFAAAIVVLWQTHYWPRRPWATGAGAMLAGSWLMLGTGLALRGLSEAMALPQATGVHLLGMGAMGGMVVAISGRAGMARVDGVPQAGCMILAGFALIQAAALLRAAAPMQAGLILPATAAWSAGWAAYLLALRPVLSGPVPRPAFSGSDRRGIYKAKG